MDNKQIKASLRDAREAIKKKDFVSALSLCKNVLKCDKNNYLALVLFGAALSESGRKDESTKALIKAVKLDPAQIIAWQGLASCYEKDDTLDGCKNLIPVYGQLLKLENTIEKYADICNKMVNSAERKGLLRECADVLLQEDVARNEQQKKCVARASTSVLAQIDDLTEEMSLKFEEYLADILAENEIEKKDKEIYFKKYLKLLYRHRKYDLLLEMAQKMHEDYPNSTHALEWICKVYCEEVARNGTADEHLERKAEDYCEKMCEIRPDSGIVYLVKGVDSLLKGDPVLALAFLDKAYDTLASSWCTSTLLGRCHLQLYRFADAESRLIEALKLVNEHESNDTDLLNVVKVLLLKALAMQNNENKCKQALKVGKSLSSEVCDLSIMVNLARANIFLGDVKQAQKYIEAVFVMDEVSTASFLEALILKHSGDLELAIEKLQSVVSEESEVSEFWLELGLLQWECGDLNASRSSFLRSAQLDQNCYVSFLYLGHIYKENNKDLDRARRCYQKAFYLNSKSEEIAKYLSDILRLQDNSEANIKLLEFITKNSGVGGSRWAWLRLGLLYSEQGMHDDATNSLRIVIRTDPNDSHAWESLADAYYARGAYTSAVKSYERVVELSPDEIYASFQIASINLLLGSYDDAVKQFEELVEKNPEYVPSLKGLGESCFARARSYKALGCFGRCRDSCQNAVDAITRALELQQGLSCLWKILGDACCLTVQLKEDNAFLTVRAWLVKSGESEKSLRIAKSDVFQLATRCYCQAIGISENSLIWQDLATVYNLHADFAEDLSQKRDLRHRAFLAAKKSVLTNSRDWRHWNTLGIVACSEEIKNYKLAQHAFIKSIEGEDGSNPITWSNLGTLYITIGEQALANKAFSMAQKFDPLYIECWIGQALLAEQSGHSDTMDLFRHTTELGIHPESCIGYSNCVCDTLLNFEHKHDEHYVYSIEKMYAIPVASDSMFRYTDSIGNNPCAYNILGLLLERQKLYLRAVAAFESALQLLESDDEPNIRDMVLCNYGRVLVVLGRYQDAIKVYESINQGSFATQCGLAVALFKAEQYENSYNAYETALEWYAPDDEQKSHVLAAMAAMTYKFQNQEDSRTLLYQCVQLQPPSVQGLFATCAFGMLNNDLTLSELTLKELMRYEDDPEFTTNIAVFRAYIYFLKGLNVEAIRSLNSVVHRHPGLSSLWLSLALLLLQVELISKAEAAGRCAQISMLLGRSSMDVTKVMSLVTYSQLLSGKATESLSSAKKAVFMFPDIPENWVVLISSFLPLCMQGCSLSGVNWLRLLISHVRRKLSLTRMMGKWLSNHERKVTLLAEEIKKKEVN